MSKRDYDTDFSDDLDLGLDLDEHDESDGRPPRASRPKRRSPRDFFYEDDGASGSRGARRRGSGREGRRSRSRSGIDPGPPAPGITGPAVPPRERPRPAPFPAQGVDPTTRPWRPYPERRPQSDGRSRGPARPGMTGDRGASRPPMSTGRPGPQPQRRADMPDGRNTRGAAPRRHGMDTRRNNGRPDARPPG